MARPTDASPNPFVGYVAGSGSPDAPIADPLAGSDSLSDAPFSTPLVSVAGVQQPLQHPQDMAGGLLERLTHDHETAIVERLNAAVKATQLDTPHWHILHDRWRTMQGWKHQIDALFEGSIAAPAAGASVSVPIPMLSPLLPGNPGSQLVAPFVNFASIGAQGTALTGVWSLDILIGSQVVPCGVFAGLTASIVRPEMLGPIVAGNIDQSGTLASLRVSILSGATVTGVTFYAQASLSFTYRFIDDLPSVRRHGAHGATESEWGQG